MNLYHANIHQLYFVNGEAVISPVFHPFSNSEDDAFHHDYDLLRTISLSTTEDMIHPTRTWLICRLGVPESAERYFLQGFNRWYIEWIEVASIADRNLEARPRGLHFLSDWMSPTFRICRSSCAHKSSA